MMYKSIKKRLEVQHGAICSDCGHKLYKVISEERLNGITVHAGVCPLCMRQATLIPVSDFQYAAGDDSKWD